MLIVIDFTYHYDKVLIVGKGKQHASPLFVRRLVMDGYSNALALKQELIAVASTLPSLEKDVITARFGLVTGYPMTLAEVGKAYGISRMRVRGMEAKVLRQMRKPSLIVA
jgi:DNA-directed RNA polymerase specialized sigma subunit